MEYTLTANGWQPKGEVEQAKKILDNINDISDTLKMADKTISEVLKYQRVGDTEDRIKSLNRALNIVLDHIRYLEDNYFYNITKKEDE